MLNRLSVVVAAIAILLAARPLAASPSPEEVERAIDRGVSWLKGHFDGNGAMPGTSGDPQLKQDGGQEAISVYTLLAAGQSPTDPVLRRAIAHVEQANMGGTYAVAMRAQIWSYLPRDMNSRRGIMRDATILMNNIRRKGDSEGLFRYTADGTDYDHSASNYGVLGLWACAQMGVEIPGAAWAAMDAAWRRQQFADGGWCYINGSKDRNGNIDPWGGRPRMEMTTAGVATLFITQEYLNPGAGLQCQGNLIDEHIARGIQWIAQNASKGVESNYGLYNMERVGVAGGYKYFGTFDWYSAGAEDLLRRQAPDGHWGGRWGDVPETCWALLFLVRGRAPIMMNKLEYYVDTRGDGRKPPTWHERPRDIANLTRWMSRTLERDLNWQIVNLRVNEQDVLDAPVLYISGKEAVNLPPAEEQKLKRYVEDGGMILGNADCTSAAFASSFKRLGTKLFGGEFRVLPDDHVIYTNEQYKRSTWRYRPPVFGLSNGVRELMLIVPSADPGRGWQTGAFGGPEREAIAQLAANIFLYAADKQNLRYKGDTYVIRPSATPAKRTVKVARLEYGGNWNPEPGGWRRLSAMLHNEKQTDIEVDTVKLGDQALDKQFAMAHMTGTTKVRLTDKMRDAIKSYVKDGGMLVVDAAGGSGEFAISMEAEIKKMFPDATLGTMALSSPLFKFFDVKEVEYRPYARKTLGNLRQPRLRGFELNGRLAVVFSAEDLSAGMVGNHVDGIVGYIPSRVKSGNQVRCGATELMGCIVMDAAQRRAEDGPAKSPAWKIPSEPASAQPGRRR